MDIYFRNLELNDIPAILDISKDIWEGDDYVPHVIHNWLEDKNSLNFGVFNDAELKNLIGFGRVKIFPNNLTWLEGARVKKEFQKQGIGREIMEYALNYSKKIGAKVVQYDTSSRNEGSISLARHFGFKMKKSMENLSCKNKEIKRDGLKYTKMESISLNQAKEFYSNIEIGPGSETCIGWSFVPLQSLDIQNSTWFRNKKAIIHKINIQSSNSRESPDNDEIWLIAYGQAKEAFNLIQNAILEQKNIQKVKEIDIFCQPDVVPKIKKIGFSYWDNKPVQVILFEKTLDEF